MSKSASNQTASNPENNTGEKIPRKTATKGKTARQIMSRHISNEKDVITDEEFKNLSIELDTNAETAHEPLDIPENPEHPKDEDKDPKMVTPWDVIK